MIHFKTNSEINKMREGGNILSKVLEYLLTQIEPGVALCDLDDLADRKIRELGAYPSFKTVPGYKWSICACVNDVVVHGVPNRYVIKKEDIIGIDCGVLYKGFHTDSSWTIKADKSYKNADLDTFLRTGIYALDRAISKVRPGNYIFDISKSIQDSIELKGYSVVKTLVGHGVGRNLHEAPEIPGYVKQAREKTQKIKKGMTLAIEVIYNMGTDEVVYKENDGWTIATKDAKISGLFETTVAVDDHGVILLTKKYGS